MTLSFELDHAQPRRLMDRLALCAAGRELESEFGENVWFDPVSDTLMLRPTWLNPEWYTQDTGAYAKLGPTDLELDSGWEVRYDQCGKGPWIARIDSATGGTLRTVSDLSANQAMNINWFCYGAGETFLQLECGWGTEGAGVSLHFWSDGRVQVKRNGDHRAWGKVTGARAENVQNLRVFEVALIPARHRELLILSKNGDGFRVLFPEIPASDPSPMVTPAGRFWVRSGAGGSQIMLAAMRFAASGFAISQPLEFAEAPLASESLENFLSEGWPGQVRPGRVYGHPAFGAGSQDATVSLVDADSRAPFVPNGVAKRVRLRVDLSTSASSHTPYLYGAQVAFPARRGQTSEAEKVDRTADVRRLTLSVPDDPAGVVLDVELAAQADDALGSRANRPARLQADGTVWMDGRMEIPAWSPQPNPENQAVGLEVVDPWRALTQAVFTDRVPLDGLSLSECLRFLARQSGWPEARILVSDSPLRLPFASGQAGGEWNTLIETGDTAADWIERLIETYAANWWVGFRPGPTGVEFYALAPTDLPSEPVTTLFASSSQARAAGVPEAEIAMRLVRKLTRAKLEPTATRVRVVGLDPRRDQPLLSVAVDYAAEDPTLAPSARPANWTGEIRPLALVDASLTSQAACDWARDTLMARHAVTRERVEWSGALIRKTNGLPAWRGDAVAIAGIGTLRITSLAVEWLVAPGGPPVTQALYTGEKLG